METRLCGEGISFSTLFYLWVCTPRKLQEIDCVRRVVHSVILHGNCVKIILSAIEVEGRYDLTRPDMRSEFT